MNQQLRGAISAPARCDAFGLLDAVAVSVVRAKESPVGKRVSSNKPGVIVLSISLKSRH
jgi:hypothetical protein